MRNIKTRITLRLRKTTPLPLTIIAEMEANLVKLWFGLPRRIFVQIGWASETNPLILRQLIIKLLSSGKTESKVIGTKARSSIMHITRKATMLANT